jgi:hypothetical protein
MPQYLAAIHHLDDYDPSVETEAMERDIDALNDEIEAAGVRIFVGGFAPARSDLALRAQGCRRLPGSGRGARRLETWRPNGSN